MSDAEDSDSQRDGRDAKRARRHIDDVVNDGTDDEAYVPLAEAIVDMIFAGEDPKPAPNESRRHLTASQVADMGAGGFRRRLIPSLLQHQIEDVRDLVTAYKQRRSIIYANQMGTGKTVTAIATMCLIQKRSDWPSLIVAPAALIDTVWLPHFETWTRCKVLYVQSADDARRIRRGGYDAVIMSYNILRNLFQKSCEPHSYTDVFDEAAGRWKKVAEALEKKQRCPVLDAPWGAVAFEESHNGKGKTTLRAMEHLARAPFRVAISGTPFLNPADIGKYCTMLRLPEMEALNWGKDTIPREQVRLFRERHVVRREVDLKLPECREHCVEYKLTNEEKRRYNEMLDEAKFAVTMAERNPKSGEAKMEVLVRFNYMMQTLNHTLFAGGDKTPDMLRDAALNPSSKMRAARRIMKQCLRKGGAIIVGHVKTRPLLAMQMYCDDLVQSEVFMGSQDREERRRALGRFMDDPETRAIYLSVMAGGQGITLAPKATAVIMCQQWFNPAASKQLFARAARKGQVEPVDCYVLYAAGTVEEHINALVLDRENACQNGVLKGDFSWLPTEEMSSPEPSWRRAETLIKMCEELPLDEE
jgi:SNF2 family DNA or RNA helicase